MNNKNIEKEDIYIFDLGKCKEISKFKPNSNNLLGEDLNIIKQVDDLVLSFNQLGKTVNRNAFFVQSLLTKINNHKELKDLKELLIESIIKISNSLENVYNNSSQNVLKHSLNQISELDLLKLNFQKINDYLTKNSIKTISNEEKIENLEKILIKKGMNGDLIEDKYSKFESEFLDFKNFMLDQNKLLNDKITNLNNELKIKDEKLNDNIKISTLELENKIKKEMQIIANRNIKSSSDENIITKRYVEADQFNVFKKLIEQNIESLILNKNNLKIDLKLMDKSIEDKINELNIIDRLKKIELINDNNVNLNESYKIMDLNLQNIENKLLTKENEFTNLIKDLNNFKIDFEKINNKFNTIITKKDIINLEKKKADKSDMIDYINTHCASLTEFNVFKTILDNLENNTNYKLSELSKSNEEINNNLHKNESFFSNSICMTDKKINHIEKQGYGYECWRKNLELNFNKLLINFNDIKSEIYKVVNERIRSLAINKPANCLSCGSPEINYPPIKENLYSNNHENINNNIKIDNRINSSIKSNSNISTNLCSDSKNAFSIKKQGQENLKLNNKINKFTSGSVIFNSSTVSKEHYQKCHNPIDNISIYQKNRPTSAATKIRPFSSNIKY